MNYNKTQGTVWQEEHDQEQTGTKKVLLYGGDYVNGVKRRIAVNENGELIIEGGAAPTPTEPSYLLLESGDTMLLESGDMFLLQS